MGDCVACSGESSTGLLCSRCCALVPSAAGLLPEHVVSTCAHGDGWLIDSWGRPHALAKPRTTIGRRSSADLMLSHSSVSRAHAELSCHSDGWRIRDLGSRNRVFVAGSTISGTTELQSGDIVAFGDIQLFFVVGDLGHALRSTVSLETGHAGTSGPFRYIMSDGKIDLCILGATQTDSETREGGALLLRAAPTAPWTEVNLSPLDFHLLRTLCARALEEADSPATSRGCVPTKELAKVLPFQSRYANEENVRQVVRRVRSQLLKLGVDGFLESIPGRGYFLAWPINLGT